MNACSNQAAAVDAPIASRCVIVRAWRRASAQRPWCGRDFGPVALLALAVVGWNGCGSSAEPVEPVTNAETAIVEAKAGFASV